MTSGPQDTDDASGVPRLTPQPVNLVLEGGGVKGIGLVGAISVLEEHGFSFVRVAGTSAGAIVGSLVAAGFTSAELHELMATLDYTKFRDASEWEKILAPAKGVDLWFHEGIYKGEYFHQWITDRLASKDKHTFGDLRTDAGSAVPDNEQYRLVVMTSDLTQGELRRLPWDYEDPRHPRDGQRIADAVRASMSIPFFFRPFELNVYKSGPSVFVDGGMLSNFPIDAFDGPPGAPPGIPTIGIKLSGPATGRRRPASGQERHQPGPGDARHHAELERPDAHGRSGGDRPHDLRRHPRRERHRLRHHPTGAGRALPERPKSGPEMVGRVR